MELIRAAASALSGATARMRSLAIAYAIVSVCAIAAVVLVVSASVLALEPHVGAVHARLIVGAVFLLIAAAIVLRLYFDRGGNRSASALSAIASAHTNPDAAGLRRQAQFAQLAMIVEAVLLGYSLSRRSGRR